MTFFSFSTDKELVAAKERQEIELTAQRATLQEQRTHIDILDKALTNAQGNVVRLEEEVRIHQLFLKRKICCTLESLRFPSCAPPFYAKTRYFARLMALSSPRLPKIN